MPVVETTLATDLVPADAAHPWLRRALTALLPSANPDLERLFPQVRRWWIDVDQSGVPQREIGFDGTGRAVARAPDDRNAGFWTDSPMVFDAAAYAAVDQDSFDAAWDRATPASTR